MFISGDPSVHSKITLIGRSEMAQWIRPFAAPFWYPWKPCKMGWREPSLKRCPPTSMVMTQAPLPCVVHMPELRAKKDGSMEGEHSDKGNMGMKHRVWVVSSGSQNQVDILIRVSKTNAARKHLGTFKTLLVCCLNP
jgi:hypothetical protein